MKKNMITATAICAVLVTTINADTQSAAKPKTITSVADVMGDSKVTLDATIGFVESFSVMGDCQEGLKARKEIEAKRDLAGKEIQEETKKYEKARNDYASKSTTMSDAARAKEEKQLMKMEHEIKSLVAEKEEELKMDMQFATENLAQNLESTVAELAQTENLDIVFDKMTGRAMYVSNKFDYTDKAIKKMNKNYEVKLAQNKQSESATKVADNKTAPAKAKISA
jgi:Skp family chaperone for outer membrane proteins